MSEEFVWKRRTVCDCVWLYIYTEEGSVRAGWGTVQNFWNSKNKIPLSPLLIFLFPICLPPSNCLLSKLKRLETTQSNIGSLNFLNKKNRKRKLRREQLIFEKKEKKNRRNNHFILFIWFSYHLRGFDLLNFQKRQLEKYPYYFIFKKISKIGLRFNSFNTKIKNNILV